MNYVPSARHVFISTDILMTLPFGVTSIKTPET